MKPKKNMNLLKPLVFLMLFSNLFILSCCSEDDNPPPIYYYSIAEQLMGGSTVTLFTEALDRIDFLDNLHGTKKYTVFAPHDDAFEDFLEENDYDEIDDVPKKVLEEIVLNHIISNQELYSEDLLDLDKKYLESSAEYALFIDIDDEEININDDFTVDDEVFDVTARNGVIHLVNKVAALPTIVTFLEIDEQFSDFYTGLTDGTPNNDFIDLLNRLETEEDSEAPFTVFAPNQEAFEALIDSNDDWDDVEDIEEETLIPILKHHIVKTNSIEKADITDGDAVETLEGDDLIFTESEDEDSFMITDGIGNEEIEVLYYDIKTHNGIIHVIKSVLIPNTEN